MKYDARRGQSPPPEESEPLLPKTNLQELYAKRLCNAFNRETALRRVRIANEEARLRACTPSKAWMALARKLQQLDVDPERFMHVEFMESVEADDTLLHGPFSNAWAGDGLQERLNRYYKYCERLTERLEAEWQAGALQFGLALRELSHAFPDKDTKVLWQGVLQNKRVPLSPLFRYCVAASENMQDVQEAEWDSALLQLLGDPNGYIKVWTTRVPTGLKAHVEYLMEHPNG